MKHLNDSELISLFKKGNNKAFEEIIYRYQAQVYTYVISITKRPDITEDIVQELFIRVFKNLNKYNDENKFKSWLFTLARNLTMDFYRKNNKKTLPLENQNEDEISIIDFVEDMQPQPIEIAIEKDESLVIKAALNELNAEERELIALKDHLTFKEISEMQNKPIGTLLSKFNRALNKLKKILLEKNPEVYNEYMQ